MRQIVARFLAFLLLASAVPALAQALPIPRTITVVADCTLLQAINAANTANGYSATAVVFGRCVADSAGTNTIEWFDNKNSRRNLDGIQ